MSEAEFKQSAEDVKKLSKQPDQSGMLKLYSLFKQGTVGDVNTSRPGTFDFVGKAKWDAWKSVEGTSKGDAQKKYIEYVEELKKTNS